MENNTEIMLFFFFPEDNNTSLYGLKVKIFFIKLLFCFVTKRKYGGCYEKAEGLLNLHSNKH